MPRAPLWGRGCQRLRGRHCSVGGSTVMQGAPVWRTGHHSYATDFIVVPGTLVWCTAFCSDGDVTVGPRTSLCNGRHCGDGEASVSAWTPLRSPRLHCNARDTSVGQAKSLWRMGRQCGVSDGSMVPGSPL
jgi:hypothetical protein